MDFEEKTQVPEECQQTSDKESQQAVCQEPQENRDGCICADVVLEDSRGAGENSRPQEEPEISGPVVYRRQV